MKNIIIIDNDPTNNYLCELTIKSILKDIKITSYTSPFQAFSSISASPIDPDTTILLLLDLALPEMNGWQFLEKVESEKIECRVFILSSSADPVDKEIAGKHTIVEGFFSKPLSVEHINLMMNNQC